MWYFAWILGLGFAVLLAIVNAVGLDQRQIALVNLVIHRANQSYKLTKIQSGLIRAHFFLLR